MKNEAVHKDMLDIMTTLHGYFGDDYEVIKGHWLACACDILGVKSHLKIPYLKCDGD